MHSRLEVTDRETGRTFYLVVRDRGCSDVDLPWRTFAELVGPKWRKTGRIRVFVTLIRMRGRKHRKESGIE